MKTRKPLLIAVGIVFLATACGAQTAGGSTTAQSEAAVTHLIIDFHVAQDRLNDFLPIMTGINDGMAGEEGFVSAVAYRNVDDPLNFTLVEQWESRALHGAHYDRIVESGDWANILAMLTQEPRMSYNDKL